MLSDRVRNRAESFNNMDLTTDIEKNLEANNKLRLSYDSVLKANVESLVEPEPDVRILNPIQRVDGIPKNLPPSMKHLSARYLKRNA